MIQNNKYCIWINSIWGLLIFSQNVVALPSNLAPKTDPMYGRGQSSGFINAMYGLNSDLTEAELKAIEKSIPPSIVNRWFIRLGVNKGQSMVTNVKNVSVQPGILTAIIASGSQNMSSKYGGELGFGYKWDKFSLELEATATENTRYDKNPLFKNQPGQLTSVVKAQGIFANTYYDFVTMAMFRAFFGVGFGAGINRTNSNFSDNPFSTGENFTRRRISGAYNLILGCKINIVPQLFVSVSLRYTNFSGVGGIKKLATNNLEWRDINNNFKLEGQHKLFAVSVNLIHIFI